MADAVKKFYNRAPRYSVDLSNRNILRYSGTSKGSKVFKTEIINISESGMGFTLPFLDTPRVDETIKIEFTPPNEKPMACHGVIKRIESHTFFNEKGKPITRKIVGINFIDLHPTHLEHLKNSLNFEFDKINTEYTKEQFRRHLFWILRDPKAVFMLSFYSFILLSSPWIFTTT